MSADSDFFLKKTISRQITPLACEHFIITATKPKFDDNNNPIQKHVKSKNGNLLYHKNGDPVMSNVVIGMNLCRASKDAPVIPWTLKDVLQDDNLKKMKSLNVRDFAIFITPQEQNTNKIFILVDDTSEKVIEVFGKPNNFLQTSPKSQQAIYTVPYIHDRDLYNKVFMYINLMYGDHKLLGLRHPFRLAGFSNRKQKYMDSDGKFPFVKTISTTKEFSPQLIAFIDKCAAGNFPLAEEIQRLKTQYKLEDDQQYVEFEDEDITATSSTPDPTPRPTPAPRPGGTGIDHRGEDFSTALRAAWAGLAGEDLENHISQNSQHIIDPCGYDMNFAAYIEKTAANALTAVSDAKANHTPNPPQQDTGHRHPGAKNFLAKKQQFIVQQRAEREKEKEIACLQRDRDKQRDRQHM